MLSFLSCSCVNRILIANCINVNIILPNFSHIVIHVKFTLWAWTKVFSMWRLKLFGPNRYQLIDHIFFLANINDAREFSFTLLIKYAINFLVKLLVLLLLNTYLLVFLVHPLAHWSSFSLTEPILKWCLIIINGYLILDANCCLSNGFTRKFIYLIWVHYTWVQFMNVRFRECVRVFSI